MKLSEAKEKFKNQWIAFKADQGGEDGDPRGEVVAYNKNRREFYEILRRETLDTTGLYITYTGAASHNFML